MELIEKLMNIQWELRAPKDKTNSFGKYKYRSCESILEAVKPLLNKYKCVLTLDDRIEELNGRVYIKAIATIFDAESNKAGAFVSTSAYAREAENKTGMDMAQLTGACSSYARKYALNGLLAIDDAKDADTNEFREETKKKKEAQPDTISFGTAPRAEPKPTPDAALPFDIDGPIETVPVEVNALRVLMEHDGITEAQVLGAFKGRYSSVDNIEPNIIQEQLINKWEAFKKFVNKEK